jgi:hypothetical protein
MRSTNTPLTLHMDSETARSTVMESLTRAGLQIVQSFDLRTARATQPNCTCPHHGTEQCNCQMVVLLVYPQVGEPATMVIHSHNEHNSISLVDTPEQRPDPELVDLILESLESDL